MHDQIKWGIIGCGDVTEVKSGPAFNKVAGSGLVAVMRRDAAKAQDYAERHKVDRYYSDAAELIADPGVNALYIATPPSSHEEYALAAIAAGKPVYVEKPMSLNYAGAMRISQRAATAGAKLTVAHYRNAQPFFRRIKELLSASAIGVVTGCTLVFNRKPLSTEDLNDPVKAWRVDPAVSGGGLFHDMAPHQLGLLLNFFGAVREASGVAFNSNPVYKAVDTIEGNILFEDNTRFHGKWNFNADADADECCIQGTTGMISFPVFGSPEMVLDRNGQTELISYPIPEHVQQPMIQEVVQYFMGKGPNPCPASEGCEVMRLIELFTK